MMIAGEDESYAIAVVKVAMNKVQQISEGYFQVDIPNLISVSGALSMP